MRVFRQAEERWPFDVCTSEEFSRTPSEEHYFSMADLATKNILDGSTYHPRTKHMTTKEILEDNVFITASHHTAQGKSYWIMQKQK